MPKNLPTTTGEIDWSKVELHIAHISADSTPYMCSGDDAGEECDQPATFNVIFTAPAGAGHTTRALLCQGHVLGYVKRFTELE